MIYSSSYNFLKVIHIVAVIAAFAPTLVFPLLSRLAAKNEEARQVLTRLNLQLYWRLSLPALLVAIFAGFGLMGSSDGLWKFDQTWLSASVGLAFILVGVGAFLLAPAMKQAMHGNTSGEAGETQTQRTRMIVGVCTGFFHLSLLLLVFLMVSKPGI